MKGVGLNGRPKKVIVRRPVSHTEALLAEKMFQALVETEILILKEAEECSNPELRNSLIISLGKFVDAKEEQIATIAGFNSWADFETYLEQGFEL